MLPIHFLADDQFDGKIHVIKTFAVKSMSEFNQFNIPVLGLASFLDIKTPVILIKRLGVLDNLRKFEHSVCGLPIPCGVV